MAIDDWAVHSCDPSSAKGKAGMVDWVDRDGPLSNHFPSGITLRDRLKRKPGMVAANRGYGRVGSRNRPMNAVGGPATMRAGTRMRGL